MHGTKKDLADYLGVHKSSVTRAAQAGRIQPEADGRYDFAKCAAAWHHSMGGRADVAARHAENRGADIPKPHTTQKNAPNRPAIDELDGISTTDSRAAVKAALLHYENSLMKIALALNRGVRVNRSAAGREAAALGAMLRAGVERVIDQCAPRLAATTDPQQRRAILDTEIRRLRWIIKREIPRAMRRMKNDQGNKTGVSV